MILLGNIRVKTQFCIKLNNSKIYNFLISFNYILPLFFTSFNYILLSKYKITFLFY